VAHVRNAPICSAIVLDNGTKSVNTRAMSRSVVSVEPVIQRLDDYGFDFTPVSPSEAPALARADPPW
jgi:hypothetical protein